MLTRLQAKAESIGLITHKEYLKKRLKFIRWAREERYTYQTIGKILGMTKEAVYKVIIDNKTKVSLDDKKGITLVDSNKQ